MKLLVCSNLVPSPILICSLAQPQPQPSNNKGKPAATNNYKAGNGNGNGNENRNGRRDLLLLSATALHYVTDSKARLLNEYLKKSQENKAKNDKERQDSYYKRNYKDYFGLLQGDLNQKQKQKKDLSESETRILEWLQSNQ